MISFDTTKQEFKDNYKLLIGSVVPRPIAVVSTINEDGSSNIAPFSFFTVVSAQPMIIGFSPMIRSSDGEQKDTLKNILRQKEFVVNFVTEENYEKVNLCSTELPHGESEFKFSGLTELDSDIVAPKRMQESPIHFECKFRDSLSYGDVPGTGTFVTGEVVKVHVKDELLEEGRIDQDKYRPVGRGAGNDWVLTNNRVQIERLMKAQIQK